VEPPFGFGGELGGELGDLGAGEQVGATGAGELPDGLDAALCDPVVEGRDRDAAPRSCFTCGKRLHGGKTYLTQRSPVASLSGGGASPPCAWQMPLGKHCHEA